MCFYLYLPYLLSELDEILFKGCAHNGVEHVSFMTTSLEEDILLQVYVYTTQRYGILKVKNALVKSVYHVLEYTICNLVDFCFHLSLKTLVTALIILTVFQEFVNGGISENSGILMDYFLHDKMD
jgi:hypothetical protein